MTGRWLRGGNRREEKRGRKKEKGKRRGGGHKVLIFVMVKRSLNKSLVRLISAK